jgi:hypothetical protein
LKRYPFVEKWLVFQGTDDLECHPQYVINYAQQVRSSKVIVLPKVGHGFAVQKNWLPQFKDSFAKLVAQHVLR